MSVVGDRRSWCKPAAAALAAVEVSSWDRWPPAEHDGAPVIGVSPVWPSTMQSRPRLVNDIGVVVRLPSPPLPLARTGTGSDSELGLPPDPAPPRPDRPDRSSTPRSTFKGPAAEEMQAAKDLEDSGSMDVTAAVDVVAAWLCAGDAPPPPVPMICRHRDACESRTNSNWWRCRWRFEISFSSCSFSSSRLSVSYTPHTHRHWTCVK